MIKLHTKRLIIRDPIESDLQDWHRLFSNPQGMYYLDDIMTHSLEESRQNLETAIAESQNSNRMKYFFSIEHKETGEFIGSIGYTVTEVTPPGMHVGAGYFLLPEHHGHGYATEAMKEIVRFAFEDNGVYRLNSGCLAENRASERVLQKSGLIKEAERKQYTWHDGRMKDRVEYRLLKDEYFNYWYALDTLVAKTTLQIDRPKGSAHPRYPEFIYPINYGCLEGTTAMDGGGIDVWQGSDPAQKLDAIMCIVDLTKNDSEIKLLIGCTEEEKQLVYQVHNETAVMKGILIRRENFQ